MVARCSNYSAPVSAQAAAPWQCSSRRCHAALVRLRLFVLTARERRRCTALHRHTLLACQRCACRRTEWTLQIKALLFHLRMCQGGMEALQRYQRVCPGRQAQWCRWSVRGFMLVCRACGWAHWWRPLECRTRRLCARCRLRRWASGACNLRQMAPTLVQGRWLRLWRCRPFALQQHIHLTPVVRMCCGSLVARFGATAVRVHRCSWRTVTQRRCQSLLCQLQLQRCTWVRQRGRWPSQASLCALLLIVVARRRRRSRWSL